MSDVVDRFYARTNGQRINSCGGILGECVAAVQSYTNVELGIGGCPAFPVGAAKDMFGTRADAFEWIRNTPEGVPPRGAIIVWNGRVGGGYGHTGVIVSANVNTFDCYQQNDPYKSGMQIKRYNYSNVIGWAIPKGGQLNPQGVQVMNREAGIEMYRSVYHREPENQSVADQWNGLSPAEALRRARNQAEWNALNTAIKSFGELAKENTRLKTDVTGLSEQNKQLQTRITELEKSVQDLQKQLANQSADTENLNKLGEVLEWLIVRLGIKK